MKKNVILLSALLAMSMASCGTPANSSEPLSEPEPDNKVDVFVLSGQSNMEGSTMYVHPNGTPLLKNYLEEKEIETAPILEDGMPNVLTSYYGFYYPNKWGAAHSNSPDQSSKEAKMTPNFEPTKAGMGVGDSYQGKKDIFFGPELGIAHTLSEYATEENPVHLIKCAFSGSGFTKNDGPNWTDRSDDPDKSLFYLLKTYTRKCLDAIEESGKEPVLRGFVWHQGESDSGDSDYATKMRKLISDFKDEFVSYAVDEDKDQIAFLDCTIYDGAKGTYGSNPVINSQKLLIANESEDDLNFCVDGSFKSENGLKLEIGDDAKGGYNTYHYNTSDAWRLGEAYGQIIVDNNLIKM